MKIRLLIGLLLCATYLGLAQTTPNNGKKLPLTLDVIWNGYFNEQRLQPKLMNNTQAVAFMYIDKQKNQELILSLDFITGRLIDTIFNNQIKKLDDTLPTILPFFEDFEISNDDNYVLIRSELKPYEFCTTKSLDYVWDRTKKTLKVVTGDGRILFASFSPDSKQLAYIYENNLYIKNLETDKITAVTFDGQSGYLNGVADPNYQNAFGIGKLFEWSKDSKKLLFIKSNTNIVKSFPISSFESEIQYGQVYKRSYPMPGTPSVEPIVMSYDLGSKGITKLDVGLNPSIYITGVKWHPNSKEAYIQRLDITQRFETIIKSNVNSGDSKEMINITDSPYVKMYPYSMYPLPVQNSFLFLKEDRGRSVITLYADSLKTPDKQVEIFSNEKEIHSIVTVDEKKNMLYFLMYDNNGKEINLYSVNLISKSTKKITEADGVHNVWLSKNNDYYLDELSTQNTPPNYQMFKINGNAVDDKLIKNKELKKRFEGYTIPGVSLVTINGTEDCNAYIITPTQLKSNPKKAIIFVYGGQGLQLAQNMWYSKDNLTYRYFAQQGYVVGVIDTRGTNGKGRNFRNSVYNQLGTLEIQDIVALKKYMMRNYGIPDKNFALIGHSYGGFLASLAATKEAGNFTAYVAIAPVTNWRLYFKTYTERLLKRPSENFESYEINSPANKEHIKKYVEGSLLLIHGSADDNVHFQNSMYFSKLLQESNKLFDQYFFPERDHYISNGEPDIIRINMFRKIQQWLGEKIKP
jgi:dipeptidyl-peptidase 4